MSIKSASKTQDNPGPFLGTAMFQCLQETLEGGVPEHVHKYSLQDPRQRQFQSQFSDDYLAKPICNYSWAQQCSIVFRKHS